MTAITATHIQVGNRLYDLANLDPATLEPEFLVPQLARLPRFQGQTIIRNPTTRLSQHRRPDKHFSVLHHTALVLNLLTSGGHTRQAAPALIIAAALHDAAEIFTGDIPAPFKRMLEPTALEDAEWPIAAAIMNAGGLSEDEATEMLESDALRTADRTAGAAEAAMFLARCPGTRAYWDEQSTVEARMTATNVARMTDEALSTLVLTAITDARGHLPAWRDRQRTPPCAYATGHFPDAYRVDVPLPSQPLTPAQVAE